MSLPLLLACAAALIFPSDAVYAEADCAPLGKSKAQLLELKASGWKIDDPAERDRFLIELADCNGAKDPVLRDGIAFEATQFLLRNRQVGEATMLALSAKLQAQLASSDQLGLRRPFAILNLSEIARTDRVKAWLTPAQRSQLVSTAVEYMLAINDYRGFDAHVGYRHAVAHTADLMMQLTLNPAVENADLVLMRNAIAKQDAPANVSYITGEPERLARPILFMAQRGAFNDQEWADWLSALAGPGELGSWENAFQSAAGLARRHNLTAFLQAVYVNADASGAEALKPLASGAMAALKKLP